MSFLGCIGYVIGRSGLQKALEIIYSANTVIYMLSAKAYSRAIQGHFLMDSALNTIITSKTFEINPCVCEEQYESLESEEVQKLSNVQAMCR